MRAGQAIAYGAVTKWLYLLLAFTTPITLLHSIENWRGRRAWQQCRQQLLALGEQLDPQAFIPAPVPDDQNFAMTPFLAPVLDIDYKASGANRWRDTSGYQRAQSAFDWPRIEPSWNKGKPVDLGGWVAEFQTRSRRQGSVSNDLPAPNPTINRSQTAAAVLQVLQEYEPVLQEIRAASRRPHARYNLPYEEDDPWDILLPHLPILSRLSSVLALRGSALLADRKADAAFEEVRVVLALSDSLSNEPFFGSQLVRADCLQFALQVIWEGLADHRWSDPQLEALQARLQRVQYVKGMSHALRAERAFNCTFLERVRNQEQQRILINRSGESPHLSAKWAVFSRFFPRGWFDLELANLMRTYQDFLVSAWNDQGLINPAPSDQQTARYQRSKHQGFLAAVWHHRLLSMLSFPSLSKAALQTVHVQATVSEAAIACALERYRLSQGAYPERLDTLVPRFISKLPHDTVIAALFKYKRANDGQSFLLYSVGWNLRDDRGVPVFKANRSQPELTQGDWVWNSAKSQ